MPAVTGLHSSFFDTKDTEGLARWIENTIGTTTLTHVVELEGGHVSGRLFSGCDRDYAVRLEPAADARRIAELVVSFAQNTPFGPCPRPRHRRCIEIQAFTVRGKPVLIVWATWTVANSGLANA